MAESRPDPGEGLTPWQKANMAKAEWDALSPLPTEYGGALYNASPVPTDRPKPRVLPPNTVCACLDEVGERKVVRFDQCQRCKAFMDATDRPEPIDEERLWKAIAGRHAADDRVGDLLNDLPAILAAYRTEPGETKP